MAFDRRLATTCCRRSPSPWTGMEPGASVETSVTPFASADGRMVSTALATTRVRSTTANSSVSFPEMMRLISSRSVMSFA